MESKSDAKSDERNPRKLVTGFVVSDRMDKTLTVRSERLVQHPIYKKYVRRFTVYKVHDPSDEGGVGDLVEIQECRPISKSKRWRLVRVIEKSRGAVHAAKAPMKETGLDS